MTRNTFTRRQAALLLGLAALVFATTVAGVGPVAADNISDTAPYYNNSTDNVSHTGWWNGGNVTLDGTLDMFMRFGAYVIGTGEVDQSGTGYVGVLLTGLIMAGTSWGAIAGAGLGVIGGSITGIAVGYGLTSVGLAPIWIRPVLLFGIGIMAFLAVRRIIDT